MGNDALSSEFVAPYEAAHKQATELATVKSILGDISGIAGDYNSKMLAVPRPCKSSNASLKNASLSNRLVMRSAFRATACTVKSAPACPRRLPHDESDSQRNCVAKSARRHHIIRQRR